MTGATLPPAIDAERVTMDSDAGALSYYVAGQGTPLLLIHSINAAGSSYEVRPIFEYYRHTRCVFALDLPGFGASERSDRRYDVALYTKAIDAMLEHIAGLHDTPCDALALSLSGEFLARTAVADQARTVPRLARIALVSPTGFRKSDTNLRGPAGSSRELAWLGRFLSLGLVGRPLFRLLTRPGVIRYFLRRTWGSSGIDEGLADYDVALAQQPGAHYAPLSFISGRLFSRDIRSVYEALTLPVLLSHGTRGDFKDFGGAAWTTDRDNWTRQEFATGALPHFEQPDTFFAALDQFLNQER